MTAPPVTASSGSRHPSRIVPQSAGKEPSRTLAAIFLILGVLLTWLVVKSSVAAYLANGPSPEAALRLDPNQPLALRRIADNTLNAGPKDAEKDAAAIPSNGEGLVGSLASIAAGKLKDAVSKGGDAPPPAPAWPDDVRAAAGEQLSRVLASAPLDARSFRLLGQLAIAAGDENRARRLMEAAAHLSVRESHAIAWLIDANYRSREYDAVLSYSDKLLRTRSKAAAFTAPYLAALAENKDASALLKNTLSQDPPWRRSALDAMYGHVTDARTPLDIFLFLKDSAHPPVRAELARYFDLLVAKKYYELAYYAWLQFLEPGELSSVRPVYNGGFERPPSGFPFDWTVTSTPGATASIISRADKSNAQALKIEFGHGRVNFRNVRQTLMLAPGRHKLSGSAIGQVTGRRGLVWRVRCVASGQELGTTAMLFGLPNVWRSFEAEFEVPASNCRPQYLELALDARSASEQLVTGQMLFDDLEIVRLPDVVSEAAAGDAVQPAGAASPQTAPAEASPNTDERPALVRGGPPPEAN